MPGFWAKLSSKSERVISLHVMCVLSRSCLALIFSGEDCEVYNNHFQKHTAPNFIHVVCCFVCGVVGWLIDD